MRVPRQSHLPDARDHEECLKILSLIRHPIIKACCGLLYACGLRIEEGTLLAPDAIDKKRLTLLVIGKGDKERLLPLPQAVYQMLRHAWCLHRNPRCLFSQSVDGPPLSPETVRDAVEAACKEAGVQHATPHMFRHSFATRLTEYGVDLGKVRLMMGHASVSTTARYTHMTDPLREEMRGVMDRFAADCVR